MSPRIPKVSDFETLKSDGLNFDLIFPDPPESTTAILVLLHGLGDSHVPFSRFARGMALPGVLSISVRGVSQLPAAILGDTFNASGGQVSNGHWHYADDIQLDPSTGDLDLDPGFEKAVELILGRLVRDLLVLRLGWDAADILLFGFGQGGSLALGMAAKVVVGLESTSSVREIVGGEEQIFAKPQNKKLKGVISIGGPLPLSCVSTISNRGKSKTPALICGARRGSSIDDDAVEAIKNEFDNVKVERWNKDGDTMPGNREEMLPIMRFFAERLQSGW